MTQIPKKDKVSISRQNFFYKEVAAASKLLDKHFGLSPYKEYFRNYPKKVTEDK